MAKVLVCDHEYSFRSSLRKSLESDGFSVHDISRSSEALKYVLKEKFDAIVFNLQPDNMISTLVFSAIRTIDKELPVIVITESDESLSSVSSIIHETFRYFRKPVGYKEIKEAINETIILKLNNE